MDMKSYQSIWGSKPMTLWHYHMPYRENNHPFTSFSSGYHPGTRLSTHNQDTLGGPLSFLGLEIWPAMTGGFRFVTGVPLFHPTLPSGKMSHNYGKTQFLMGKLPEGRLDHCLVSKAMVPWCAMAPLIFARSDAPETPRLLRPMKARRWIQYGKHGIFMGFTSVYACWMGFSWENMTKWLFFMGASHRCYFFKGFLPNKRSM